MAPKAHSDFPASSSARLLACPGSYALGLAASTGVRTSSIFAAEGTLAHAISEACLVSGREAKDFIGREMSADGFTFKIDQEFVDAVDVYVNFIRGLRAIGYLIMLEQKVTPQAHWQGLEVLNVDLFGTSDLVAFLPAKNHLVIGDLKFGRGVPVEAEGNSQLRYYGAGVLSPKVLDALAQHYNHPGKLQVDDVDIIVIQPRAPHPKGPVRREEIKAIDLIEWSRTTLHQGVKRALEDNGQTLNPGDHCRWCPAKVTCPAMQEMAVQVARDAFANVPIVNVPADQTQQAVDPGKFSDDQLADLMTRIEIVQPWMAAVMEEGKQRLTDGQKIKGFKLVAGPARRKFPDAPEVTIQTLIQAGLKPGEITDTVLLSPRQIEQRIGKKKYDQYVAPHVGKANSGRSMRPEGDPRQRVGGQTAQEAFNLSTNNKESE